MAHSRLCTKTSFYCALFSTLYFLAGVSSHEPDILPGWLGEVHRIPNPRGKIRGADKHASDSVKVVQLSWKPRAFLYQGFLTPEECDHLIEIAKPELKRSMVVDKLGDQGTTSQVRTSSGMFIPRSFDPIVKRIEEKIARWTFLPEENGEDMQILRYNNGQHYSAHHDAVKEKNETDNAKYRMATVLMYLSDVEKGGETIFPTAKDNRFKDDSWSDCGKSALGVKPKKGNAILFFSLNPNGVMDMNSLHTACPVVEGTKWAAVKWIHEHKLSDKPFRDPLLCIDEHEKCAEWAAVGECSRNPNFMVRSGLYPGYCRKSCNACMETLADKVSNS